MVQRSKKRKTPFKFGLDLHSGVPVYRQLMDQVLAGVASGTLGVGDQLPTVRQLAVDLEINLNTVLRAYRELEFAGMLETQQGMGTFVTDKKVERNEVERTRQMDQLVNDFLTRVGAAGFTLEELLQRMRELSERR